MGINCVVWVLYLLDASFKLGRTCHQQVAMPLRVLGKPSRDLLVEVGFKEPEAVFRFVKNIKVPEGDACV